MQTTPLRKFLLVEDLIYQKNVAIPPISNPGYATGDGHHGNGCGGGGGDLVLWKLFLTDSVLMLFLVRRSAKTLFGSLGLSEHDLHRHLHDRVHP